MNLYKSFAVAAASLMLGAASCETMNNQGKDNSDVRAVTVANTETGQATAAFAEGCFWCTEEVFEAVVGVDSVISGYAGGTTNDPTYDKVNTETTGHAETVLVYYDPTKVDYEELTRVFYLSHDPTTLNRQGPDRGTSYRSVLFYQTPEEKEIADRVTAEMNKDRLQWQNRDGGQAIGSILSRRRVPPGLCRAQPRQSLRPKRIKTPLREIQVGV